MSDSNLDREYDQLKQDIAKLRGDLSALVNALKDAGLEKVAEVRDRVEDGAARDALKQAFDTSREQGARAANHLEAEIARRPLTAVLVALGLGFVIAKLMQDGGEN